MKKSFFLVTIIGATAVQAGWIRTYGGIGHDYGTCIQETSDGGYIATGSMEFDTVPLSPRALWILKTDTSGNELWSKTYGDTDHYTGTYCGNFVRETSDGGYIITGVHSLPLIKTWLLKIDPQGDTLWTRDYGISKGHCVQELKDGGYIVTGQTRLGDLRMFLLKTNSSGDSLWMRTYLPDGWAYSNGNFVQQTDDGGFIIAGSLQDSTTANWGSAFWLIKADSLGNTLWTYIQGHDTTGEADEAYCVRATADKNYIAIGTVGTLKLNTGGDTIWSCPYAQGASIVQTSGGGYVITGVDEIEPPGYSSKPLKAMAWLAKMNSTGDFLWKQIPIDGTTEYVEETMDHGFISIGHRHVNGGDLLLVKTDSLGFVEISENPVTESECNWFVSRSIGNYVVLNYQGLAYGFRAKVFDVLGRKIGEIQGNDKEGAIIWGANYPSGVYFIQIPDNHNQPEIVRVVLVK